MLYASNIHRFAHDKAFGKTELFNIDLTCVSGSEVCSQHTISASAEPSGSQMLRPRSQRGLAAMIWDFLLYVALGEQATLNDSESHHRPHLQYSRTLRDPQGSGGIYLV